MNANITTKPELGKGMYTIPDAAVILDLPGKKMRRWIKKILGDGVCRSGEDPGLIASVYGLSEKQIEDTRPFMKRLAA